MPLTKCVHGISGIAALILAFAGFVSQELSSAAPTLPIGACGRQGCKAGSPPFRGWAAVSERTDSLCLHDQKRSRRRPPARRRRNR